ncbi:MAG TPA: 6-phosphogluconolactonase [Pyrinomonadaceae bacterium]|nr:6-phosphogluconolactonase [Pyrinomonadaceae bacterium]
MSRHPDPKIIVLENPEEVAQRAAEHFVKLADQCVRHDQLFSVALAGGNTPRRMYELLATDFFSGSIDWSKVHIFFGDERSVPHDLPESNFRLAYEALLEKVTIPAENVHRMNGVGDLKNNAREYEDELREFFRGSEWPQFDLVLLGLGKDAHTASLFPQTDALNETRAWVAANWVQKLNTSRITLTAPAINAAAQVMFMVTGADKAQALKAVLGSPSDVQRYPAQLIKPSSGELTWLVDAGAASLLENH